MNKSYAYRRFWEGIVLGAALILFSVPVSCQQPDSYTWPAPLPQYCKDGKKAGLPLPSSMPLADYEGELYGFLFVRKYQGLNWCVDRGVRDTGPYIQDVYYGNHPAVRIYYSPGVMKWLANNRQGEIPDGAMIIKEMFNPPAVRYDELRQSIEAQFADDPEKAIAEFEAALQGMLTAWTVLVKDKSVSKDGWFWAGPAPGSAPDTYDYPFNFPTSTKGSGTCMRCHASADSEVTFSSLSNIKGFEKYGDPLRFKIDNSWRTNLPPELRPAAGETELELIANLFQHLPESHRPQQTVVSPPLPGPNPAFLATFDPLQKSSGGKPVQLLPPAEDLVKGFPGQWADHVPPGPKGAEQFITSDNCLGCHGGLAGPPYDITMFVKTGPNYGDGFNISAFGEWRWSPMGLAGRDPIFFAQLESEFALLAQDTKNGLFPENQLRTFQQAAANTCLSCHGAMGQRQLEIDTSASTHGVDDPNFYYPAYIGLTDPLTKEQEAQQKATMVKGLDGKEHSVYPYRKYGDLAREGISCTVCHHIDAPTQWTDKMSRNEKLEKFLLFSTTGVFPYSKRDELNGPFDDVKTKPMENALGITPKENPYIKDSKMCGTCHAINLPNVDAPTDQPLQGLDPEDQKVLNQAAENGATGEHPVPLSEVLTKFQHSIEQATYLEWENSDFAWDPKTEQSCQDCHMPGGFRTLDGSVDIDQLSTQIATIQDSNYPDSDNVLPAEEIDVPVRDNYRRHELVGLNVFVVEMFNQFDRILGVDQSDFMTSATNGDELAIENMVRQARNDTVALDLSITSVSPGLVEAEVKVTNKVGHRLPSGVGFRRVFLEVVVTREIDGAEEVIWGSGRTNSVGVILDGDGVPLETEFLDQGSVAPPQECAEEGYSKIALYQPHHAVVDSEDQVQIYEELVLNREGEFTTSFIHRDCHPKDNRLTPFGTINPETDPQAFQDRFGDDETIKAFMKATIPEGAAKDDPDFGPGTDTVQYKMKLPQGLDPRNLSVKATMYSQAIPPYWLHQRFSIGATLPKDQRPGTERLYYLASHLNTAGTPIENWKLKLVSEMASVEKFLDK